MNWWLSQNKTQKLIEDKQHLKWIGQSRNRNWFAISLYFMLWIITIIFTLKQNLELKLLEWKNPFNIIVVPLAWDYGIFESRLICSLFFFSDIRYKFLVFIQPPNHFRNDVGCGTSEKQLNKFVWSVVMYR